MSEILRNPNGRLAATILSAGLLLTACSSTGEANPEPTTTTVAVAASTTLSPEMQALALEQAEREAAVMYVTGSERNDLIDAQVQFAGTRIVAAADSGIIGPFDFYNFETGAWGRTANEGWGYLQHNAQYGGISDQVSAFVYMDSHGVVDLSKGVKSILLYDPNAIVEYNAPGGIFSTYEENGPIVHENSWSVRVATYEDQAAGDYTGSVSSETEAFDTSQLDLLTTEVTANTLFRAFMTRNGL